MFRKTRTRLVILNSVVFFLLINSFGASLYFYMQYRLDKQAEATVLELKDHLAHESFSDLGRIGHEERELNRNVTYLIWDDQKRLQQQSPAHWFAEEEIQTFKEILEQNGIQMMTVANQSYLVANISVNRTMDHGGTPLLIQVVYSLHAEQVVLHHLLLVIGLGSGISVVIAILAGYFLASKALIPIQSAWERQQQFVSDASHELRTPLAAMIVQLGRLFRHPTHTIEEESQSISAVLQETKRMSRLVSQLLTLARSDSNQLQLMMGRVNVTEVLQRTVDLFKEIAELQGIAIRTEFSEPLTVKGDEEQLQQLFVILLDNAVKYTGEKGGIEVLCDQVGSHIRVQIQDTGSGIVKEDLPFLFNRFFRGNKARTRSEGGAGLGLSIAKSIIDAHQGKIEVKSEVGKGTCVSVLLPADR